MRTTCVRGIARIRDATVIRGIIHHAAVFRIPRERLCRSQEETVPEPHGGTVRPREGLRGGGASVPTGRTGPVPVSVRGSTQGAQAPRRRFQQEGNIRQHKTRFIEARPNYHKRKIGIQEAAGCICQIA